MHSVWRERTSRCIQPRRYALCAQNTNDIFTFGTAQSLRSFLPTHFSVTNLVLPYLSSVSKLKCKSQTGDRLSHKRILLESKMFHGSYLSNVRPKVLLKLCHVASSESTQEYPNYSCIFSKDRAAHQFIYTALSITLLQSERRNILSKSFFITGLKTEAGLYRTAYTRSDNNATKF